ncbi:MAG: cytochrome P450 [Candidatus Velthaea sp.]
MIAPEPIPFDPFAPAYLRDPYPALRALQAQTPVAYAPAIDMWVITRYEDVDAVFKDSSTYSAAIAQAPVTPLGAEAQAILADGFRPAMVMSNLDPPEHARIRAHTIRAFSARRIALLEPTIRTRAADLIDAFTSGGAELIGALTFPLPAITIFTMIGFPDGDIEQLKAWCGERLAMTWGRPSPADQVRVAQQMVAYWKYCVDFVAQRTREPADDFTSDLLATAREVPGTLDDREIASIIYGLSFAGHETTTNLIANTLRRVLERREAWDALVRDPGLIHGAVEEALRFDTSVIAWRRITTKAASIGGVDVPAGAKLLLLLAAANHDPARFPDPERFDIRRPEAGKHLAFGKGIHYCLGAALARLQVAIVLELLGTRFPGLRLCAEQKMRFHPNIAFRGPHALHVEW